MARGKYASDGEFSGGEGMVQPLNIENAVLSGVEEVWSVYATDPESTSAPDPRRIGDPASYSRSEPGLSAVPPVNPVRGAQKRS